MSSHTPIPSERSLCEKYKVSRPTVRKALIDLENEGYIYKISNVGRFVAERKYVDHELQWFIGTSSDAKMQKKKLTTKVLQQTIILSNSLLEKELNIKKGESIFLLERLRILNRKIICLDSSYIPLNLCEDIINIDFESSSLYEYLKKRDIDLYKAKRSIEVRPSNVKEATHLKIKKGEPIILFHSLGFTKSHIPFEYVESKYPAYKTKFETEVYS